MKRLILTLAIIMIATVAQAQCVAEITDVTQDYDRGSIVVHTRYTLNGAVVQNGQTRYLETSGTETEIIAKAKEDGEVHCENLIRRIETNRQYLNAKKLERQKELTASLVTSMKSKVVGYKSKSITEVTDTFKEKDIKVTYDSKNTVTNSVSVIE